jgi:hypothetical protein
MAKVTKLSKYAKAKAKTKAKAKPAPVKSIGAKSKGGKDRRGQAFRQQGYRSLHQDLGLDSAREKEIGSTSAIATTSISCRTTSASRPFLKKYMEVMGWDDLNWLEDVHLGYEEGRAAIFDRNVNGWVTVPKGMKLPDNQQDRDMIARELLIKFQMSPRHPLIDLNKAYRKF